MLKAISQALVKTTLTRSLLAFSTCNVNFKKADPNRKEPARIDNEIVLMLPEQLRNKKLMAGKISVPVQVDMSPITGVPEEHVKPRRVRIYQPPKNAMQSGTSNQNHWEVEFDNRLRWENPLMGWASSGDPLSNMKVQFTKPEEAIEHCEKHGWIWFLDVPKVKCAIKRKDYSTNFSWNRRTRVTTK